MSGAELVSSNAFCLSLKYVYISAIICYNMHYRCFIARSGGIFRSAAAVNAAAASRDYKVYPRIDYRTITGVEGPLVIMENVKFPTYGAP